MKKRTRFSMFLLVLAMTALAVPEAFGLGSGRMHENQGRIAQSYSITCADGRTAGCTGSFDFCCGVCTGLCGGCDCGTP
jgi:hypothetical protein